MVPKIISRSLWRRGRREMGRELVLCVFSKNANINDHANSEPCTPQGWQSSLSDTWFSYYGKWKMAEKSVGRVWAIWLVKKKTPPSKIYPHWATAAPDTDFACSHTTIHSRRLSIKRRLSWSGLPREFENKDAQGKCFRKKGSKGHPCESCYSSSSSSRLRLRLKHTFYTRAAIALCSIPRKIRETPA